MRLPTVIASVVVHVGLAAGLVAVAQKRELRHRAISVAVQDEKKKAKPKPPAPPKTIVHAVVAKASAAPKAAPVSSAPAPRAAAVAMNLAMSNAGMDVGPGIGLQGRAEKPTAAPLKMASALSERRNQRTKEEAGLIECQEEPTQPEVEVQAPALDYTIYPQAQADGIEGKFKARLTISANGEVESVTVQKGLEPAFDAAIVAALKRWRFKPAMACGKAVVGTIPVNARFELGD